MSGKHSGAQNLEPFTSGADSGYLIVPAEKRADEITFFRHPLALVESEQVGASTRIGAFSHVHAGAVIGGECELSEHVFVESDVVLGNRVTVKNGAQLCSGVHLEDDVFIGPNVAFTSDVMPRSGQSPDRPVRTLVRAGASIGANATIIPGLTIGQHAMVGAGSVVTRSVPPHAIVAGNPARILRYVDEVDDGGEGLRGVSRALLPGTVSTPPEIRVRGVRLVHAPVIKDLRGNLTARENDRGLPFLPKRCFVVFDVPSQRVRGEHAHRECEQLLVCLRGRLSVVCDDGFRRQEIELNSPELGLYLPPMIWGVQYKYSSDAMLLVLASHTYDADDYVRSYDEFLGLLRAERRPTNIMCR